MPAKVPTPLQSALFAAGYVRSPNAIHGVEEWYAGAAGIPEPLPTMAIQVSGDRLRIFTTKFFGEAYSRNSFMDTVTVAVFGVTLQHDGEAKAVHRLLDWCREHGRISQPGLPAFSNSWD